MARALNDRKGHSALICLIWCMALPVINSFAQSDIKPVYLRVEYKENPFVDVQDPRLSWELQSKINGQMQSAYQIVVSSSPQLLSRDIGDIWDTKKVNGDATNQIVYSGAKLISQKDYYWKVRSWDKDGHVGSWSAEAKWGMGLLTKEEWTAKWIGVNFNKERNNSGYDLSAVPYFHKAADLKKSVKKARIYITALGLYEFYINGKRIGNDYFAPGWTNYDKRVYYRIYDITNNLKIGSNELGAILSAGWYAGYIGYALFVNSPQVNNFYGSVPALKAQLEIEYTDGTKDAIVTDETWNASKGPLLSSDILEGETYDARLASKNWALPGYKVSSDSQVEIIKDKQDRALALYPGSPVQVINEIAPVSVTSQPDGKYIFNMGQNFAGQVQLKIKGNKGDSVTLRYGEMLYPDGKLMTDNLRKARATDIYILNGNPNGETWEPSFTYHGFQYVEISGLKNRPSKDMLKGIVLSASAPVTGSFETDNTMLNKLYKNITWTQHSNYFDIPTDCPQRDERLGWTGDAQIYIKSATFNNDIAAFYTKWITDLNDAQWPDGRYPIYAPMPLREGKSGIRDLDTYSPGWSEAGIICPYTIYKTYADTRIIKASWSDLLRYMEFLKNKSKGQYYFPEASFEDISPKGGFGDWLSVGKKTPPDMLATMYYGYCATLMSEMASAIGDMENSSNFKEASEKIKKAFIKHYTDADGRFVTNAAAYGDGKDYVDGNMGFDGNTQTAYDNAIYMGILSPEAQLNAGQRLADLIRDNGNKLTTGFLGFKPLLPALSVTGHSDIAYHLLLSTDYPSLGFEVKNGATTIWERWNSYTKERGFENNAGMNSFNHYSFGAVCEWMYGNIAGIKGVTPGYKSIIIKPEIAKDGVNYVKARYHSINGEISSSWKKSGKQLFMSVLVPVNTMAEIYIPTIDSAITVKRNMLNSNPDLKIVDFIDGYLIVKAGSGFYHFTSDLE